MDFPPSDKEAGTSDKSDGQVKTDDHQLIGAIYDFAIDIDTWLSFLDRLSTLFANEIETPEETRDASFERHLGRATYIVDRIAPQKDKHTEPLALNSTLPIASMALSKNGEILGLNGPAKSLFDRFCASLNVGDLISFSNDQNTSMLYGRLKELTDHVQQIGPQLFQLLDESDGTTHICCLVRLRDVPPYMSNAIASQLGLDLSDQYLLIAFQRDREQQDEVLSRTFGLTPAESRLVLLIADGGSLDESAEILGVSIHTVRAQLKSAFAKTGTKRQQDLTRIVSELETLWEHAYALVNWQTTSADTDVAPSLPASIEPIIGPVPPHRFLSLSDGRRLAYRLYGPENGIKVLFFHAMVAGSLMPEEIIADAHRRGLCLICPERPGVGLSSDHEERTYESVAEDFKALVDSLGGGPCKLASHASGAAYAMAFASRYPENSEALGLCCPRPGQLFPAADKVGFSIRSYLNASSARPWVLTAFVDLSRKRLNSTFIEQVTRRYYRDAKADMAALDDPKVMAFVTRNIGESLALSSQGFRLDSELMASAPPIDPSVLSLPLLVWGGQQDQAVNWQELKAFYQSAANVTFRHSEEFGQLLFPLRWADMIDWLLTIGSD